VQWEFMPDQILTLYFCLAVLLFDKNYDLVSQLFKFWINKYWKLKAGIDHDIEKCGNDQILYIVLCGRNPVFIISEFCFEVRFRYLKNLDSCTLLQISKVK